MINKIIDGISIALDAEFGSDYEIYTENIEQGLKEPCFSIICLNPRMNQFLGKRYFKQNQFCIHYFPKTKESNEPLSVIERLFDCLEIITVDGDECRGTGMNAEIVGGVISFIVNYDMFVRKEKESVSAMETLGITGIDVKG